MLGFDHFFLKREFVLFALPVSNESVGIWLEALTIATSLVVRVSAV